MSVGPYIKTTAGSDPLAASRSAWKNGRMQHDADSHAAGGRFAEMMFGAEKARVDGARPGDGGASSRAMPGEAAPVGAVGRPDASVSDSAPAQAASHSGEEPPPAPRGWGTASLARAAHERGTWPTWNAPQGTRDDPTNGSFADAPSDAPDVLPRLGVRMESRANADKSGAAATLPGIAGEGQAPTGVMAASESQLALPGFPSGSALDEATAARGVGAQGGGTVVAPDEGGAEDAPVAVPQGVDQRPGAPSLHPAAEGESSPVAETPRAAPATWQPSADPVIAAAPVAADHAPASRDADRAAVPAEVNRSPAPAIADRVLISPNVDRVPVLHGNAALDAPRATGHAGQSPGPAPAAATSRRAQQHAGVADALPRPAAGIARGSSTPASPPTPGAPHAPAAPATTQAPGPAVRASSARQEAVPETAEQSPAGPRSALTASAMPRRAPAAAAPMAAPAAAAPPAVPAVDTPMAAPAAPGARAASPETTLAARAPADAGAVPVSAVLERHLPPAVAEPRRYDPSGPGDDSNAAKASAEAPAEGDGDAAQRLRGAPETPIVREAGRPVPDLPIMIPARQIAAAIAQEIGRPQSAPQSAQADPFAPPPATGREPVRILKVALEPVELGRVTIQLRTEGSAVHLAVTAERAETHALLSRDRHALSRILESSGFDVKQVTIQFGSLDRASPGLQPDAATQSTAQQSTPQQSAPQNAFGAGAGERQHAQRSGGQGHAERQEKQRDEDQDTRRRRGDLYV